MVELGISLAVLSGLANGLFTAPMKVIPRWKWENIWLVFILTSCLVMPSAVVFSTIGDPRAVFVRTPPPALASALGFGFAWGFGAILFGLSVDRLGVSLSNSMVLGVSAAMGSLVPLILHGTIRLEARQLALFGGVAAFMVGVSLCGAAGRLRDRGASSGPLQPSWRGYLFALGAGLMSAVFNIGYSLALPIAEAGEKLGFRRFLATNCIWLLMLGAGAIPNIVYCVALARKHRAFALFLAPQAYKTWGLSVLMGVLWGGSIFLYGAATPLLGDMGPSIGWPLSLAVGLVVANLMGILLGEWKSVEPAAGRRMRAGVCLMLVAIVLCALAAKGA
jgi:L-rhamnose-H+ transport protein